MYCDTTAHNIFGRTLSLYNNTMSNNNNISYLAFHQQLTVDIITNTDSNQILTDSWSNQPAIYWASSGGDIKIVEALLDKGVDVNITGNVRRVHYS
jgi:hypothetical protein